LYHLLFGERDDYDNYEPKEVLQMRYAKGEIDNIEYLERMVRL